MSSPDQGALLAAVINQGFDWAKARETFRRVSDSKRATETDRKKAMKLVSDASLKLERTFMELMRVSNGQRPRSPSPPIDWSKVAGVIAKGAGALETALVHKKGPVVEVIDTEGKEV